MYDQMLLVMVHLLVLRPCLVQSDRHLAEWDADLVGDLSAEVRLVLRHDVVNKTPTHPHVLWLYTYLILYLCAEEKNG